VDLMSPFRALCSDVLGAQSGKLVALGPLATFSGKPLVYPESDGPVLSSPVAELVEQLESPQLSALPLVSSQNGGATWAVPLWGERGLTGLFLLGPKQDGGLYSQEEIEIARLAGERLIDAQASAEMAGRLMSLQRQRLAQSQVVDQQTRRTLHDDILPRLHTAMLTLTSLELNGKPGVEELIGQLTEVHRSLSNLLRAMPSNQPNLLARLGMEGALRSVLENELAGAFDTVSMDLQPEALAATQELPSFMSEVLFFAAREVIRNAARYAREDPGTPPLHLAIRLSLAGGVEMLVEDNGRGIKPPLEKAPEGEKGQGLALHSTMLAIVGGSMSLESEPGAYTRVRLWLPATTEA
jgi:signal transduction histidine kinase